jgi:4-hydroxy-3-polyprenylbenzoate decarboxylase
VRSFFVIVLSEFSDQRGRQAAVKRLIVGISGASGVIYGIRLLEMLQQQPDVQTHLILTSSAKRTILIETEWSHRDVEALADEVHSNNDVAATISSGSFHTDGMVVSPCSMKTLSGIVHSYSDNMLARAADVVLKEGRKLVLMPREVPLHSGHLNWEYTSRRRCPHSIIIHRLLMI